MDISLVTHKPDTTNVVGALALESIKQQDFDCAVLLLNPSGHVRDANTSAECLFGYSRSELTNWHVSVLLPKLAEVHNQDVFRRLAFLSQCGATFRANRNHGHEFPCAVFFTCVHGADDTAIRLTIKEIRNSGPLCL